jgi:HTH-type transcriptional regulator/antitoxin HipB
MTYMYEIPQPRRLGSAAREERRKQQLTQADLADAAGVSRGWLIKFEQGHETAEMSAIFRVLTALGMVMVLQPRHTPSPDEQTAHDAFEVMFDD